MNIQTQIPCLQRQTHVFCQKLSFILYAKFASSITVDVYRNSIDVMQHIKVLMDHEVYFSLVVTVGKHRASGAEGDDGIGSESSADLRYIVIDFDIHCRPIAGRVIDCGKSGGRSADGRECGPMIALITA